MFLIYAGNKNTLRASTRGGTVIQCLMESFPRVPLSAAILIHGATLVPGQLNAGTARNGPGGAGILWDLETCKLSKLGTVWRDSSPVLMWRALWLNIPLFNDTALL